MEEDLIPENKIKKKELTGFKLFTTESDINNYGADGEKETLRGE
jgi:hypothetical protein